MAKKIEKQLQRSAVIGHKTEELPVRLIDSEVMERGEQMAGTQGELEKHKAREDETKAALKADRTRLEAELQRLALAVRNRSELRPVQVETVADYELGVAREIRGDTGEIVRSRTLRPDEVQARMFAEPEAEGPFA